MPELPEVETVRRGLEPIMVGQVISHVELRRPDLRWPLPAQFAERISGFRVVQLNRRGKYLLAELSSAETLLVHLGMSGRLLIHHPEGRDPLGHFLYEYGDLGKHDHVILDFQSGCRVIYNDVRRFGAMDLIATDALSSHTWLEKMGPEPLGNGFHAEYLAQKLVGRKAPLKALLLDQRLVAGLGNIYVNEALWLAKLSPERHGGTLEGSDIEALIQAIQSVLRAAIAAGGTSLRDYRQADGELGYFQHQFKVYGRTGQPCQRETCTGTVIRFNQSGRSSYACPMCQK